MVFFFFFQCYLLQKQAFMDQAQTSLCETGFQMDQKRGTINKEIPHQYLLRFPEVIMDLIQAPAKFQ